ncbi:transporter substrate-binding domain-containing protein [uncultured Roseobacter sp.]|uniref:transporter substrate-binding domain-containing protein n=1 Tax=uncultured Roseobacter sp. TaxID=114847 RepID=UPI002601F990|nr:transporter substrate-binding domain-containing protein [uncultured Roseobacter sp.]
MRRLCLVAGFIGAFGAGQSAAEICGGSYEVARGDSLSLIANRLYKDAGVWTRIHADNKGTIGDDPDKILVGAELTLSCIGGLPQGLSGPASVFSQIEPLQATTQQATLDTPADRPPEPVVALRVITGNDQPPFSDETLAGGGMMTEVMTAILETSASDAPVEVFRINDWGSHLSPLLTEALMDVSYPWPKPDCNDGAAQELCQNYVFSDPMFEMLMVLFVDAKRPVPLNSAQDIEGRHLCRAAGRMTFMLDVQNRNWLRDGQVTLLRAPTVEACFDLLVSGEVDAVVVNEFTGRSVVASIGRADHIVALNSTPLDIVTLHAVVSRNNPRAEAILDRINTGLRAMRRSGRYQEIVDRHLRDVWAGL